MSVRGNAASRGMTAHDRIRLTGPFAENSSNTPNPHLSQVAKTGSAVYDIVGVVKAFFMALGRKKCEERRRRGEIGVKGAFFAFISTLDTGLPTSTMGLGRIAGSF